MAETLEYKVTLDGIKESNREIKTFGDAFKDVAIEAGKVTAALFAVSKGFNLVTQTAEAFFIQQKAENRVEQALLTTGNAANLTAEELKKAASELQGLSNFGDEQLLAEVTNSLLTFKNVTGDTFLRAQKVIADMSVVFGGLQTSAMSVGFALNDVSVGITRLRRNGIQFSDSQIETIKNLQATNRLAEAQAIILSELESQFGGLAEATADPITQMKNAWGDLVEVIGKSFAPIFYNFKGLVISITESEQVANILSKTIKVGLAIALAIAAKAVIALIVKMKTLITTMTIAKTLSGDWVSILLSVGTGIASVALMTKDWTGSQESLNKSTKNTITNLEGIVTANDLVTDSLNSAIKTAESMRINFEILASKIDHLSAIENRNETQTRLLERAIEDYNSQFGAMTGNIDDATIANNKLSQSFSKVRNSIIQQATLEAYYEQIKKLASEIVDIENSMTAEQKKSASDRIAQLQQANSELDKQREIYEASMRMQAREQKTKGLNYKADQFELNKIADLQRKNLLEIAELEARLNSTNTENQKTAMDELLKKAQETASQLGDAVFNISGTVDIDTSRMSSLADFQAILDKRKQLTAQYYDVVKWQDDNYYDYRLANIEEWTESLKEAGNSEIDIEKAKNIKIEELNREKADADRANLENSLSVMKALYNEFYNAVQGMQFDFLHGWVSFTKSVEQSWKSMINNMLSQLVTSGLLTLLASLFGGGFTGVGLFGSVFGGLFKEAPMTPSMVGGGISSTPIITNNSNTYSSNTDINPIVNKLNEVVSAVERIKFSIGRVELAREVEAGNIMRGVSR